MGAKLFGRRSSVVPDNDNIKDYAKATGEIPIPHDERRVAPVIEKQPGKGWYCLVTLPQHEYACQDNLGEAGIPSYVPTDTYWERRKKGRDFYNTELQRPIFRGYVFAHLPHPEWRTDPTGADYPVLPAAWAPTIKPRHQPCSPAGVLSCLGTRGYPVPMPIRFRNQDGTLGGIAPLSEEERAGWFDERRRPALIAQREQSQAEAKRLAEMPAIAKGESVEILSGPFAGQTGFAENDNNEQGRFKMLMKMFGGLSLIEVALDDVENLERPMRHANIPLRRA